MDLELSGKVAVITGGSSGIGLAVADGLAREGVNVALCARDAALVSQMAQQISQQHGVEAFGMGADVSQPGEIDAFVAEIERRFGGADILINNAGAGTKETIMDAPDDKWLYTGICMSWRRCACRGVWLP
jgi:NAD(P)-dependent dehydrogenase (short-subunit alcohol dehydrogenase family)